MCIRPVPNVLGSLCMGSKRGEGGGLCVHNRCYFFLLNESFIESRIHNLLSNMNDPQELEQWADEHGEIFDLSEYRSGDGTGDERSTGEYG